jgi:hypothetical protein
LACFAFFCERQYGLSMTENAVAREIVDAAYRIHRILGPDSSSPSMRRF